MILSTSASAAAPSAAVKNRHGPGCAACGADSTPGFHGRSPWMISPCAKPSAVNAKAVPVMSSRRVMLVIWLVVFLRAAASGGFRDATSL
jgi:hypothetical protein